MRRHVPFLVSLLAALALAGSAGADTAGVAVYKEQLNAICRANLHAFWQNELQLAAAERTNDSQQAVVLYGQWIGLNARQDRQLSAVPVPSAARARMRAIFTRLRSADRHNLAALAAAQAMADPEAAATLLQSSVPLQRATNPLVVAFGLIWCGYRQN